MTTDGAKYRPGSRVICRTNRGLETGSILAVLENCGCRAKHSTGQEAETDQESDGVLVRPITVEDDLLLARLEKNKEQGYEACVQRLRDRGINAALMDIEHLFDGRSLFFYFLGEITPAIEEMLDELAELYESKVQFRQFAQTLADGCGPNCGTEQGGGCGESGGCSVCAVAAACKVSGS